MAKYVQLADILCDEEVIRAGDQAPSSINSRMTNRRLLYKMAHRSAKHEAILEADYRDVDAICRLSGDPCDDPAIWRQKLEIVFDIRPITFPDDEVRDIFFQVAEKIGPQIEKVLIDSDLTNQTRNQARNKARHGAW